MVNVRAAVEGVREGITRLASNTTPDMENVLLLNLRERRDALSRSIQQLSPATLSMQVLCPRLCHLPSPLLLERAGKALL